MCKINDVEPKETIWSCGLVYSVNQKSLISQLLNTFSFAVRKKPRILLESSEQMSISGEMVFQMELAVMLYNDKINDSVLLLKLLKFIYSLFTHLY